MNDAFKLILESAQQFCRENECNSCRCEGNKDLVLLIKFCGSGKCFKCDYKDDCLQLLGSEKPSSICPFRHMFGVR